MHTRIGPAAILLLGLGFGGPAVANERLTLIAPGQPAPVIYVGLRATADEKLAAQELQTYLQKITGKKLAVHTAENEVPGSEASDSEASDKGPRGFGPKDEPRAKYIALGLPGEITSEEEGCKKGHLSAAHSGLFKVLSQAATMNGRRESVVRGDRSRRDL